MDRAISYTGVRVQHLGGCARRWPDSGTFRAASIARPAMDREAVFKDGLPFGVLVTFLFTVLVAPATRWVASRQFRSAG